MTQSGLQQSAPEQTAPEQSTPAPESPTQAVRVCRTEGCGRPVKNPDAKAGPSKNFCAECFQKIIDKGAQNRKAKRKTPATSPPAAVTPLQQAPSQSGPALADQTLTDGSGMPFCRTKGCTNTVASPEADGPGRIYCEACLAKRAPDEPQTKGADTVIERRLTAAGGLVGMLENLEKQLALDHETLKHMADRRAQDLATIKGIKAQIFGPA